MHPSKLVHGGVLAGLACSALATPAQAGDTENWSTVDTGATNGQDRRPARPATSNLLGRGQEGLTRHIRIGTAG